MVVAVTGANGHVGSNLCRELIKEGHRVKALIYNDKEGLNGLDLETIKGDVLDPDSLAELFDGADIAIHLAAVISIKGRANDRLARINVEGTRNVLGAVKKSSVKKLIHFSSIHALVNSPVNEPMDETRPLALQNPLPYEKTKSKGESLVREAGKNGLEAVIINPTSIIGPNDFKPSLVGQLLIRLYKRHIPAIVPGGYNWVDVRDVCRGAINAIEKGRSGESYILSGQWQSLKEISEIIGTTFHRNTPTLTVPFWLARVGVPFITAWYSMQKQHPLYTQASLDIIQEGSKNIINEKAANELGYISRPLQETIKDTIEFFREKKFID